jgi:hypothetical protein
LLPFKTLSVLWERPNAVQVQKIHSATACPAWEPENGL